jgi:hypothetical protein
VALVLVAAILALSLLVSTSPAHAQGRECEEPIAAWIGRCAQAEQIALSPSHCPADKIVVRVGGDAKLSVEIARARAGSFRRAGEVGLSPVGEFADWSAEPEARRRGLEALAACVTREPPTLGAAISEGARNRARIPWLLLGALAALGIACGMRVRARRAALLAALGMIGAAGAVLGLRWALLPGAFFHQNGHGAAWIAHALSDRPELSSYGPGYAELFGWIARAGGSEPERSLFALQAVLGALAVPCAFVIARGCGAGRLLAAVLALAVALDPLLARLAQSESYFASFVALAFVAAAALAQAGPRVRSIPFAAAVIAAGLITAQAARIHPLGWLAFALLPIVPLCGRGRLRTRLGAAAASGLGVGLIVLLTSGRALLDVLHGSLGKQWLPAVWPQLARGLPWIAAAVVVVAFVARKQRVALLAVLGLGVIALIWTTNILSEPSLAVARAYERPFWPLLVALLAAVLGRLGPKRAIAGGVALLGIAAAALQFRAMTELPTDAREARLALEWRRGLPEGAVVAYLERADHHIFTLPLYGGVTAAQPFPIRLEEPALPAGPSFYYRSSVCSSPTAAERCAELERALRLEPVSVHELPALPSMRWNPYASGTVRVGLFRRL